MRWIRRLFDFYIFSNMHVGLATFSLTKITLLFVGIHNNELPLFVFLATILSYNFIRIYRKAMITSWLYDWLDANRTAILLLSMLSFVGLLYVAFTLRLLALLSLIPFGILTLFYVLPLRIFTKSSASLRTLSGLKIFLIAFCWAGITVLFPLINYEAPFSIDVFIVFIQRFLFVLVITIPFDIRDLKYDDDSLKTLPQILGVVKAKRLGLFLLMLFLGLLFLRSAVNESLLRTEFVIAIISLFFLVRSKELQSKYYSAFFVEGIPIVWLLLILMQ